MDPPIPRSQRHFPMIEFFNDETEDNMDLDEVRLNYQFEEFDELEEIMHRPDMENRDIDVVHPLCDNLFSCLSKEIFGTEFHYDFVRDRICQEVFSHPAEYKGFIVSMFTNAKEFVEIHATGVQRNFPIQDVDILATATFFQTPIYVLCIETDGSSRWKEYTQIRRRPRPPVFPKRISKCRQLNKSHDYYITLLLDPSGRYHRIVPRYDDCNCSVPKPIVPRAIDGNAHFVTTPNGEQYKILFTIWLL